jgi:putative thioredoxin
MNVSLSEFIVDVSEATFETEVLLRSHEVPVIVDFWAPWCGPCKMLGPLLERMAIEAGGSFYLAKINVDENPNLSIRYGVQGIPAVKAFINGEVKGQFVGAQPESLVKRFMEGLLPSEADRVIDEANSLLATRHWSKAEQAFREVLEEDDSNSAAALGLVKSLLMLGKGKQATSMIERFPLGTEWALAERLKPLAKYMAEVEDNGPHPEDDPLLAEFYQSARLILRGNLPAAMDGLLDLLRQDKNYRNGEVKAILLAIFQLHGEDDPLTREYRDELASILF